MKILQVVPYFHPAYAFGGPVKGVYQISKELVRRGHEVVIYTSDAKDFGSRLNMGFSDKINGIRVYRFRNLSMMSVKKMKFFITPNMILYARKEVKTFDIIHLDEYTTFQNIIIHHYATKYGVPYVLQPRGSLARIGAWRKLKWFYNILFGYRLLKDASKVVALSPMEALQQRSMGVPREKIEIIHNGINLSEYASLPPKGFFKKKVGIDDDEKIVLYLGRIHEIKGIDILVKAFAKVIDSFDDVKLVIVGPDDGYLGKLEALIKALKIKDDVLILGPLYDTDKLEVYVDADICVLPSRYETFPNVVLEAYACSKPVIASNVESISDIVLHGETGLLVRAGDVKELANAITFMLTRLKQAEKMGCKARKFVEEKFSIDIVVTKLEAFYERVLKNEQKSE